MRRTAKLRFGVKNLPDALDPRSGDLPDPGDISQSAQRFKRQTDRGEKGHEIADSLFAGQNLLTAIENTKSMPLPAIPG